MSGYPIKANDPKGLIMLSANKTIMNNPQTEVEALKVQQALIALELGASDDVVLGYLDFFTKHIPFRAAFFLHILPKFDLLNAAMEQSADSIISNVELNQEIIKQMDGEIRSRIGKNKTMRVDFDVREGNPLEELLKETEDSSADLVVIGQKTGVSQHGILAKNLARKVACNALVVPDLARPHIRKILVPIDFSGHSARALRMAVAINKQLPEPAEITCLNVYDMPNLSVYRIQKTRDQLKRMIETDRKEAFNSFLSTFLGNEKENIKTELIEREMPGIAHYLLRYARENTTDFIVMGAKGHSKVELLLLGSVTEKLLNDNERIPTLIVK